MSDNWHNRCPRCPHCGSHRHGGECSKQNSDGAAEARRLIIASGEVSKDLRATLDAGKPTWDTEALKRDFEVIGFAAPYVVVKRRSDGAVGSLAFVHEPRVYFEFEEFGEEVQES